MSTSQAILFGKTLIALTLFMGAAAAHADTIGESVTENPISNRQTKKLGVYLGMGDPAPTLFGVSVAYNAFDFLRLTAGYGSVSVASGFSLDGSGLSLSQTSISTIGAGAKFMMPGWSLTPVLGLNFASVSYSGSGAALNGFTQSGSHVYTNIGADWQAKSGFNVGAGYQMSLRSGAGGGMYLNAGWFFDFLG